MSPDWIRSDQVSVMLRPAHGESSMQNPQNFDPASASAPFMATLVDVTGLVIYVTITAGVLNGTLL